jgi:hypothetical protein
MSNRYGGNNPDVDSLKELLRYGELEGRYGAVNVLLEDETGDHYIYVYTVFKNGQQIDTSEESLLMADEEEEINFRSWVEEILNLSKKAEKEQATNWENPAPPLQDDNFFDSLPGPREEVGSFSDLLDEIYTASQVIARVISRTNRGRP